MAQTASEPIGGVNVRGSSLNASASANNNPTFNIIMGHGASTDTTASSSSSTPTAGNLPAEFSSQTYCRLLLAEGRGFPLWDPKPPHWLPSDYTNQGVQIGDVGILHTDGYFDFLFNICLTATHPINRQGTPRGFSPPDWANRFISHPGNGTQPGDYAAKGSVEVLELRGDEYLFKGATGEGAILVLPRGTSIAQDPSIAKFRDYAGEHAVEWYEAAQRQHGRDAPNGSIYLITGWEKTSVWGTASFRGVQREFDLHFRNTDWTKRGVATAKSGRSAILKPTQCVFLKGFKVMLGESLWDKMRGTVKISEVGTTAMSQYSYSKQSRPWGIGERRPGNSQRGRSYTSRGPVRTSGPSDTVTVESINPSLLDEIHPSNLINRHLLSKVPEARLAITHDNDWCHLMKDMTTFSLDQIDIEYEIRSRSGVCSPTRMCKKGDLSSSSPSSRISLSTSVDPSSVSAKPVEEPTRKATASPIPTTQGKGKKLAQPQESLGISQEFRV